jgi:antitoxin component YwqK of YwqJK toxin-antitoxin module
MNSWHENGKPSQKFTYKNGAPDGKFLEWNENGTLASESTFKDGHHTDGPCKHYAQQAAAERKYGTAMANMKVKPRYSWLRSIKL